MAMDEAKALIDKLSEEDLDLVIAMLSEKLKKDPSGVGSTEKVM